MDIKLSKISILVCIYWATISTAMGSPASDFAPSVHLPPLKVNLKLIGTAMVDSHADSVAVLEVDGQHQLYCREGDWAGNVLIEQILRDRVIVDAGSGEVSIMLRQSMTADTQGRHEFIKAPPQMQSFGPRPPEGRNLQVVRLDQSEMKSLIGEVDQAMQDVDVSMVTAYGRKVGIRISPIEPDSIFSAMGLKQGEVISDVGGVALTDSQDAIALFERIKQGGEFDITVKGRRTRRIHMIVD